MKELTAEEKRDRAIKLHQFFMLIQKDIDRGDEIFWENVWQRALWILEDPLT